MNARPAFYDIEPLLPWLQNQIPLITPNLRLARHIKYAWALYQHALDVASWPTPEVYSLSQWWQVCERELDPWQEQPAPLAQSHQELELWVRCVTDHQQGSQLLRPRSAARQARDAYHNLLLWRCDWRDPRIQSGFRYNPDTEMFLDWAESFEQRLQQQGLLLGEQRWPVIAEALPKAELVLVDFDELAPLALHCLELQASELHHYRASPGQATCHVQPCADREAELAAAASWAAKLVHDEPSARIGILIEDIAAERLRMERLLREELLGEEVIASRLVVNFSAGSALSDEPVIDTALRLLELLQGRTGLHELVHLLHSRYRRCEDVDYETRALRRLQMHAEALVDASQLHWFLQDTSLGENLLQLRHHRDRPREASPSQWRDWFQQCLTQLGWPGSDTLTSREYQLCEHWRSALERFAELDGIYSTLSLSAATGLLRSVCQDITFQEQTPDSQLQVLGFLEAAGLQFDHLWICGMGRSGFPATPSPNPFIPVFLQKQLAMPHADSRREFQFGQRMLQRFENSASALIASYVQEEDGIAQAPSPLLQDYRVLDELPKPGMAGSWQAAAASALDYPQVELKGPAVIPEEHRSGGSGLLMDQSLCQFRGFVRRRLNVEPLPQPQQGLTASDRGQLMHAALQTLWQTLKDSDSLKSRQPEWESLVTDAVASALAEEKLAARIDTVFIELEKQRLQRLLMGWLEIESQRAAFAVSASEQDMLVSIGDLELRIRADRIDTLADGSKMVIDYKSGDMSPNHWLSERPQEPQLPLYAYTMGSDCSAASYAVVRSRNLAYRGFGNTDAGVGLTTDTSKASAGKLNDWTDLQEHWRRVLEQLARSYLDGDAAVDPPDPKHSCRFCGLQSVCRIGEQVAVDD